MLHGENSIALKYGHKSSNAYLSPRDTDFICFYTLREMVFTNGMGIAIFS